jgi:hypothetical protein
MNIFQIQQNNLEELTKRMASFEEKQHNEITHFEVF